MAGNIKDILKLKENFLKLSDKKIESIKKTTNDTNKPKLHINMTTKCYNLRTLEWIQRSNPCIEKTQENSIESSLQNGLPYILP